MFGSEDANELDELISWMQQGVDAFVPAEHREEAPRVRDVLGRRGRTFVAQRDLHPGDLVLRFPRERLMHSGFYKHKSDDSASDLIVALERGEQEPGVFIAPQTFLAVYMLFHRRLGRRSPWSAYLDALPSEFPSVPVFYTQKEFEWLKGSSFVARVQRHAEALRAQYETVARFLPGFADNYTVNDFLWARCAISTRVFGWDMPGTVRNFNDFMVPLGDMFNHRSPKMLEWQYNGTTDTLDYWVREDVPAGGELLISYGAKSNALYLLHYGFAVAGLPQRNFSVCTTKVPLDLDEIPDQAAKRKWLIKAAFTPVKDHSPAEFDLSDTWNKELEKMIAHARLLVLPTIQDLERKVASPASSCTKIAMPCQCKSPVSITNEREALSRCLDTVQNNLRAYPTTLEEDEAMLPELSGIPLSLVLFRRDEKFVLRWAERFFKLALAILEVRSPQRIARRCTDVFGEEKCSVEIAPYIRETLFRLVGGEGSPSDLERATWFIFDIGAAFYIPFVIMLGVLYAWYEYRSRNHAEFLQGKPAATAAADGQTASSVRRRRGRS